MRRPSHEPPRSRRTVALVVAVLAAAGAGGVAYVRSAEEPASEIAEAPVADAAADARVPKAKPKPGKKPRTRGGKTQVANRSGGGSNAAPPAALGHGKTSATPRGDEHRPSTGPSYESALDGNDEQVTIGAKGRADLTDAQLAAPLSDGAFVAECGAPDSMSVTVKVAIRMGHAVGVSTETSPPSPGVASCIDGHVRALTWPASAKLDSLVTAY